MAGPPGKRGLTVALAAGCVVAVPTFALESPVLLNSIFPWGFWLGFFIAVPGIFVAGRLRISDWYAILPLAALINFVVYFLLCWVVGVAIRKLMDLRKQQ